MKHMQTYPVKRQLKELAYNIPFPMSCGEMVTVARYMDCSPAMIRLLQQFGQDDVFENGVDFISRCEGVQLFTEEVRKAPREQLHSPQG